jgi:hypothetical protein
MACNDPETAVATSAATDAVEAAAFRSLLAHLRERSDVQNIDLMIMAGFCRNCLADWYQQAAANAGAAISREQAREHVYGMPFADWKALHQAPATPEQLARFDAAMRAHPKATT